MFQHKLCRVSPLFMPRVLFETPGTRRHHNFGSQPGQTFVELIGGYQVCPFSVVSKLLDQAAITPTNCFRSWSILVALMSQQGRRSHQKTYKKMSDTEKTTNSKTFLGDLFGNFATTFLTIHKNSVPMLNLSDLLGI